jgi:ABC-type branched-subunit amino acid transport system ATPase component
LVGVSLSFAAGTVTAIIGPNGAGKTTLLDVIAGHQQATAGRVLLDGHDLAGCGAEERARAGIAMTAQVPDLTGATARDAVAAGASVGSGRRPPGLRWLVGRATARRTPVDTLLHQAGLAPQLFTEPLAQLGLADLRRIDLARALARQPRLLLLDEPASGQGAAHHEILTAMLRRLARQGLTVVVVDHELGFVKRVADTVIALDAGAVIARGSLAEVLAHPQVRSGYLEP